MGAPTNSWTYEEFTFPEIVKAMASYDPEKHNIKHAWMPMRMKWTSPSADLMFDKERAYRFVRTLTDAGCAITWGNTNTDGFFTKDEMDIMKKVDKSYK